MSARIGLIGGGAMGEAMVGALLKEGVVKPADVVVSDAAKPRRQHLESQFNIAVTDDNTSAGRGVELVVLAVKPQDFGKISAELSGNMNAAQTVLSIMAGVRIERIAEDLRHKAVVRAMPNTAALVGQAMTVWTATADVSERGREFSVRVLQTLGREIEVGDEKYLDMATAVSGSGPGFVFLFLEALIDAGVHIGMRRDLAQELALQTVFGSACLAGETGKHLAELRNMVTSPAGTTAAGLQVLEEAGFRAAVMDAVEAAHERAKELGA